MDMEDEANGGDAAMTHADMAGEEPEDIFELELDGQVHTLPGALKGAFLRQADYTRKTQELAEHRRAAAAERETAAQQIRSAQGVMSDRAHLAALDLQLEGFEDVDWQGLAQAEPRRAQALWERFEETRELREHYAYALSHHEAQSELNSAREAAERMAQTGRVLQQEIDGWSPEIAAKLVDYAQAFGVTHEELAQMADPRLWKLLHKAHLADQAKTQESAGRSVTQGQGVRPAVLVSGAAAGGGGVRDELATREWMARRNAQMTKGR